MVCILAQSATQMLVNLQMQLLQLHLSWCTVTSGSSTALLSQAEAQAPSSLLHPLRCHGCTEPSSGTATATILLCPQQEAAALPGWAKQCTQKLQADCNASAFLLSPAVT